MERQEPNLKYYLKQEILTAMDICKLLGKEEEEYLAELGMLLMKMVFLTFWEISEMLTDIETKIMGGEA